MITKNKTTATSRKIFQCLLLFTFVLLASNCCKTDTKVRQTVIELCLEKQINTKKYVAGIYWYSLKIGSVVT